MNSCFPATGSPEVTRPTAPHPTASAATRPESPTTAGLRRGRKLLVDGGHRLLAAAVDREHPVETGDLEDLGDVPVAADEGQLAVVRAQALHAADEHAERCGIDEGRIGEVHDDVLAALADYLE